MKLDIMWIYQTLLCVLLSLDAECRKPTLQRYQKSENSRLLCKDCPASPRIRNLSLDDCARKCSKSKKSCRAFYFDQINRKCHLLPFDRFSEGAKRERKPNCDLFEKKDYVRECIIGSGVNYKGRRSITKTGITCQSWNMSIPHEHNFKPARHKKFDLRQNFCRNPDNDPSGPWCFTELTETRHQECGLPQCTDVECMRCNGETYRGPMDHTESGKECQRWDSQKPHKHTYQPHRHVGKGLDDNYCRNPNNDVRPWCYTMDKSTTWEYCNISVCDSDNDVEVEVTTSCFRGHGEGYRGTVSVTPAGVTCQRWDALFPHNHSYTPHNYKCKDLRENYCRNPDGSEIPWCFTTDPKVRKAFCTNIPRCEAESSDSTECYEDIGESYRGNLSKTRSGIPCGLWSDHTFRRDTRSAEASAGLELNLCRNPDRDKHGPWCYTSNSSIPWDYCGLERCKSVSSDDHQKTGGGAKPSCFIHKTTRIVGGMQVQRAEDGSWVVSIQKRNRHWCGGSLIREDWVLTDQQCFSTCVPDLSEYTIQVGLLHLNASADTQDLRIAHVVCGPEGSNLALLKLTTPAPLSEHVRTVQLPVAGCAVAEGTYCLMYGWGDTKGTGHEGSLKMVGLPIVSNKRCSQSHKGILPITETKICAGGKRDQGVCEKDYGGPLVCQEGESKVIVGVSINGRGCAVARRPAVFVNVAFYSEWIRKVFKYYSDMEISY
ncbi:hepatocyte growth factor a isoform X1 [Siphateles boraxobius]|uniref:hepatocyte growth factor a isoform X1 n=1 Tax=Siphateles boraxobius TaxID=180520 RepID=UPI0040629D79